MSQHPGTQMLVASTGDNEQENNPTISNYQSYFGTTYGTFVTQGIFMQVRGNHDGQSAGSYTDFDGTVHNSGAAYWDYFGPDAHMFNIEGKKLTDYSYDLGSWHIVALDQISGSVNTRHPQFPYHRPGSSFKLNLPAGLLARANLLVRSNSRRFNGLEAIQPG